MGSVALHLNRRLRSQADDFTGKSPSGNLAFASQNEKRLYKKTKKIWPTANPNKQVRLNEDDNLYIHAAAISPDDAWVALEEGGGSAGHTILFFIRQNGLEWKQQVADADPVEIVGNAAPTVTHIIGIRPFYVAAALRAVGRARTANGRTTNWGQMRTSQRNSTGLWRAV
jgi:hypothetical protein